MTIETLLRVLNTYVDGQPERLLHAVYISDPAGPGCLTVSDLWSDTGSIQGYGILLDTDHADEDDRPAPPPCPPA